MLNPIKGGRREIIHKKVREAEEEVREVGDVYPLSPPPPPPRVLGSMVNVSSFENLTLYLLLFM